MKKSIHTAWCYHHNIQYIATLSKKTHLCSLLLIIVQLMDAESLLSAAPPEIALDFWKRLCIGAFEVVPHPFHFQDWLDEFCCLHAAWCYKPAQICGKSQRAVNKRGNKGTTEDLSDQICKESPSPSMSTICPYSIDIQHRSLLQITTSVVASGTNCAAVWSFSVIKCSVSQSARLWPSPRPLIVLTFFFFFLLDKCWGCLKVICDSFSGASSLISDPGESGTLGL